MFEEFTLIKGAWVFIAGHGSTQALFATHPLVALWLQSNDQLKEVEWQIGRRRIRIARRVVN